MGPAQDDRTTGIHNMMNFNLEMYDWITLAENVLMSRNHAQSAEVRVSQSEPALDEHILVGRRGD